MIRALVVDDHPSVRQVVRMLLERSGDVEVVGEAGDGQRALEEVEKVQPDVVVLDLHMPRLDGVGVLKALAERVKRPKVVVLTINGANGMKELVLAAGASALVPKNLVFKALLPAVRKAVSRELTDG